MRKARKRAWRSTWERSGAALNLPAEDVEGIATSSKPYVTLTPPRPAFCFVKALQYLSCKATALSAAKKPELCCRVLGYA